MIFRVLCTSAIVCLSMGRVVAQTAPATAATTTAPAATTSPAAPLIAGSLRELTGAHARVVWQQNQQRGSAQDAVFTLMGYDTDDGKGERTILAKVGNYFKPLLTSDGRRIVYTDATTYTVRWCNFDGSDVRDIGPGQCLQLWRDPATAKDYAFIQRGPNTGELFRRNPMYKVSLANPADAVLVWDKTPITYDNFQVSRDGTRATMEGPWPRCLVATLPNGAWDVFGRGCYTMTLPDDSYFITHLDGMHRHFFVFKPGGELHAKVPVNTVPSFKGRKIHQPRFANHPLFFTMSAPQPEWGSSEDDVEMWAAKFSDDLTRVVGYARISDNRKHEYYPDMWIEGGDKATLAFPQKPRTAAAAATVAAGTAWPGDVSAAAGLTFLWDSARAKNVFTDPATGKQRTGDVMARGNAIFGRFFDMNTTAGYFMPRFETDAADIIAATKARRAFTFEAIITTEQVHAREWSAIVTLAPPAPGERAAPNFQLSHGRKRLRMLVAHRPAFDSGKRSGDLEDIGTLEPGKPAHVVVTVDQHRIAAWVNGVRGMLNVDTPGRLDMWADGPLVFGAEPGGKRNFAGSIEAVAVYARAFTDQDAQTHYAMAQARLAARKPIERLVVEATVQKITPTLEVSRLGTYTRALSDCQYRIDKVISGKDPGREIVVRHWVILDRAVLPSALKRKEGDKVQLTLEPYEHGKLHAELDGERTESVITAALPVYYDVSRDGASAVDTRSDAERLRDVIIDGEPEEVAAMIKASPRLLDVELEHPWYKKQKFKPVELSAENTFIWKRFAVANTRALLEHGGTIDFTTAARAGLADVVRAQLAADKTLLNAKDALGRTALQRCVNFYGYSRDTERVADLLYEAGAEVDIFTASTHGKVERVAELLKADKAQAKAVDWAGCTPLHCTVRPKRDGKKSTEITKLLLEAGADAGARAAAHEGMTPLMMCAEWTGSTEQVDMLMAAGADVDAKDEKGWTALDYALDRNERKMVEHLKRKGAHEGERSKKKD